MEEETVMQGLGLAPRPGRFLRGRMGAGACDRTGTGVPDGHLPGRTGTIPDLLVRFSAGVRLNERGYPSANCPVCGDCPDFNGWIARKSCLDSPKRLTQRLTQRK